MLKPSAATPELMRHTGRAVVFESTEDYHARIADPALEVDVAERRLHLHVEESELAHRRAEWIPPEPAMASGYQRLYVERVLQADQGCDFDFLVGCRGAEVARGNH